MTIEELNTLGKTALAELLTKCCGSTTWVGKMCKLFPMPDEANLFEEAIRSWNACHEEDWLEAFSHHPKIGDTGSLKEKFSTTADWAAGEQSSVKHSSPEVLEALYNANRLYEEKFGYIFIVCATGKPAEEMLRLLQERLNGTPEDEIKIAMTEQQKITALRLEKLLHS